MHNMGKLIHHGWSLTMTHAAGGRIWRRGQFLCILSYDGTLRQCAASSNAPHRPGWASEPFARAYWRSKRNGVA
jgi:hypothetical protein